MHFVPYSLLASVLLVSASPVVRTEHGNVHEKRAAPAVTIASGTIVGSTDTTVDSFNGIPFAQPPIGNLRLKPPQPITGSLGTVNAVGIPRACPQMISQTLNISALTSDALAQLQAGPLTQILSTFSILGLWSSDTNNCV